MKRFFKYRGYDCKVVSWSVPTPSENSELHYAYAEVGKKGVWVGHSPTFEGVDCRQQAEKSAKDGIDSFLLEKTS